MSRWWRAYDEAVDDPKLQALPPLLFKAWFNLLCTASKNGGKLPPIRNIAFSLRINEQKATKIVSELIEAGLLDRRDDGDLEPHNWGARQYLSDKSNARVERHRAKRIAAGLPGQWVAPKKLRREVYARDNYECVYCGNNEQLSLDHRTPETRGGTHDLSNLATACMSCNGAKRDMTEDEYRARNADSNGGVTLHAPLQKRPQNRTEQNTEKKDSCSNEFERFWKAYPRRVGKKVAEKALAKALRETSIDTITEALAKPLSGLTRSLFLTQRPGSMRAAGLMMSPTMELRAANTAKRKLRPGGNGTAGNKHKLLIRKGTNMHALVSILVPVIVVVVVGLIIYWVAERFSPDPLITKIVQVVVFAIVLIVLLLKLVPLLGF